MISALQRTLVCFSILSILSCSNLSSTDDTTLINVDPSYLKHETNSKEQEVSNAVSNLPAENQPKEVVSSAIELLPQVEQTPIQQSRITDLALNFDDQLGIKITSEDLSVKEYIHYVFNDILKVSYIIGGNVKMSNKPITMNITNNITKRKLFSLSQEILNERGYVIRRSENIYYINSEKSDNSSSQLVFGYGKRVTDVPSTTADIVQFVPISYGIKLGANNLIKQMSKVKLAADAKQNLLYITGKRTEVIKALEFIQLIDRPAFSDKYLASFKSQFISSEQLKRQLIPLLNQDGIQVSEQGNSSAALYFVALERTSNLVIFAQEQAVLKRAIFWAEQLDQPVKGAGLQYFIYQPENANATDLGESLGPLIGQSSRQDKKTSANAENQALTSTSRNRDPAQAMNSQVNFFIDSRSNNLIFHTTGETYYQLLPLIKRLDIMPKQVALEVLIAEVTLTDEFKLGVEFAFTKGRYSVSTEGSFGVSDIGGLTYSLLGSDADVLVSMMESNSLVNVLSRPSLVVIDGVDASISVGNDIPTAGATTFDPISGERQTTTVQYRKTGIELAVTPTVNSQGVVLLEISQQISNEIEAGTTAAVSPSFFQRSVITEVLAQSGQTVILGGLISENRTVVDSGVPILSSIPLIGGLFSSESTGGDKTELVIMVTPKIIESMSQWDELKLSLTDQLNYLSPQP